MTKTSASLFRGLPTRACVKRKRECYVEILARIHDQLFSLMTHHSRITVFRVDLRFPDGQRLGHQKEGQLLSAYIESVKAKLGSLGVCSNSKVIHGAAKEIGAKKGKPHFHVFFGFNSRNRDLGEINALGHTDLWKFVNQKWVTLANGTTHIIPKVHRFDWFDKDKLALCFKHLSYLAKVESKDYGTGEHHKRFTASRLEPNPNVPAATDCEGVCNINKRCRRCALGFSIMSAQNPFPPSSVETADDNDDDDDDELEASYQQYRRPYHLSLLDSIMETVRQRANARCDRQMLKMVFDSHPSDDETIAANEETIRAIDDYIAKLDLDQSGKIKELDEFWSQFNGTVELAELK